MVPVDKRTDRFSLEALEQDDAVSGLLETVKQKWHRPLPSARVLTEHVFRYGDRLPPRLIAGDYFSILYNIIEEVRPTSKLIPLTNGAAFKHPDFPKSTSPGYPWTFRGFSTKGEVIDDTFSRNSIHRAWDSIGRGVGYALPPCSAFHRTVASEKEKLKIRLTWGYPVDVIAEEARFFYPLFASVKQVCHERDAFYGIGLETALGGVDHIRSHFERAPIGSRVMNADLSEFDQHVPSWIIRDVFSYLGSFFDFSRVVDAEGKIWSVNPDQTVRRWNAMVSYFIKTKIRLPTGGVYQKFQGVPSGSMWTNLMDTIVNAAQMRTVARRCGLHIFRDYYYGDDSTIIFCPPCNIDVTAFSNMLLSLFGGKLHPDKTELFDDPSGIHWLGYRPSRPSQGATRPLEFLVASTIYPERECSTPIESCARLLGQAYSTMDAHACIPFLKAVTYLRVKYSILPTTIDEYLASRPLKHLRYLVTLGLSPRDITVPQVTRDPFSPFGLRCDRVVPKHPTRPYRRPSGVWFLEPARYPEFASSSIPLYSLDSSSVCDYFHDFGCDSGYYSE